jgi:hypothetical protein
MATMPSRSATAPLALRSVLPQVDGLWLFLDRFEEPPPYAADPKIRIVRSQDAGDLRANGKFAGAALEEAPCIFFGLDDDIEYPADYCARMSSVVERYRGAAVIGVHAAVMRSPMTSYVRDTKVFHRRSEQREVAGVDVLGSDSVAFHTSTLRFDVRAWPDRNMVDLSFALEARRRAVPLVMLDRRSHWLAALDENQDDSIWVGLQSDDSRQTALACELAALPRPRLPRRGLRRLRYREA